MPSMPVSMRSLRSTSDFCGDFPRTPRRRWEPCQDMIGDLLRQRGYEVDDWHIDVNDVRDLRGFGPIEHDFFESWRTVVGTYRPSSNAGKIADPAGSFVTWCRRGRSICGRRRHSRRCCRDGKMYGRGACDMKSGTIGCASMRSMRSGPRASSPPLRITFKSVIEEDEHRRRRAFSTSCSAAIGADACFIPEPTSG